MSSGFLIHNNGGSSTEICLMVSFLDNEKSPSIESGHGGSGRSLLLWFKVRNIEDQTAEVLRGDTRRTVFVLKHTRDVIGFPPGAAYTFAGFKMKLFPGQQTHSERIFQLGDVRSFSLNGGKMMSSRWLIFRAQNGFARNNSVNLARWVAQILTS